MEFFSKYLKNSQSKINKLNREYNPEMVVVVPAFTEPFILNTLNSLKNNDFSNNVLVLIVVNYSVNVSAEKKNYNLKLFEILKDWVVKNSRQNLWFDVLFVPDMPRKHAGAGLARKIGMDTAIDIFYQNQKPHGVISSLDADCKVNKNYLSAIYNLFRTKPKTIVALIDFIHEKKDISAKHQLAAFQYELYLHYYVMGCRLAGFPYAYHTIGSCFALAADTYVKQGGMNKKHAGEDFYFLHKLFPLGNTVRIYETTVRPSSRVSDRVPFGTGPALQKILDGNGEYWVYNFNAFCDLSHFYGHINMLYRNRKRKIDGLPVALNTWFNESDFMKKVDEANANSGSYEQFKNRIFRHFDAFQLVKYLNFAHEKGFYKKIPVHQAVSEVLQAYNVFSENSWEGMLNQIRKLERTTHPH